jgi:hypothetical protein
MFLNKRPLFLKDGQLILLDQVSRSMKQQQEQRSQMQRIRVSEETAWQLKIYAAFQDTTLEKLVDKVLRSYLDEQPPIGKPEIKSRFKVC